MNFGLKTLLIGLTLLGAFVGVMGKLLLENPENFLQVLYLLSTVGLFILAICTIAWLGVRGNRFRSKPVCAQCKYDLRVVDPSGNLRCPVCDADLAHKGAIQLACEPSIRKGLILWAGILLLTPLAVQATVSLLLPTGNPLHLLSNQRLIHGRLPTQADAPWLWQELEHRLAAGELTHVEVDAAIRELISHMKATKPNGWNQPLAWQRDFLKGALQAKLVSDQVLLDLYDAFYGPRPSVQPLAAVNEAQDGFQLELRYDNPWSGNTGLDVDLLWNVKSVVLDEKSLRIRQVHRFGQIWSGYCEADLEPGEHQVTVEVEAAYIDPSRLIGPNKAALPIEQWPKARKRWTIILPVKLKVDPTTDE